MKALMYTAIGAVEMTDIPEPTPGPGEVKIRVTATGICGSDVHGFLGHSARRQPGLVLGHETTGMLSDGRRVSVNPLISCGLCPACRAGRQNCCGSWRLLGMDKTQGAFAEYVNVPERNIYPLADSVSDAAAVMVEPLANAFHLLSLIPFSAGVLPKVAIIGAGTLGACILSAALARGLQVVAVSEPNPERAAAARSLGATTVLDPTKTDVVHAITEATDGWGADVVLDAVGTSETRNLAAKAVCRGGTALLLGMDHGPTSFDFFDLVRREVRLQTSFAYTEINFAEALQFVTSGVADFQPWTDVMPLDQGQAAFERLISSRGDRIKIALVP